MRLRSFRLPIDRAVLYGFLHNLWSILSSTVTAPLILVFLSPVLQGYFYTFQSLLGIQTLFILGLGMVIQQFVSHEWARLRYDDDPGGSGGSGISGDPRALARLASLRRFTLRWYAVVSVLAAVGLAAGGGIFLGRTGGDDALPVVRWLAPWLAVSAVTGFHLFVSPALVFLEGCNYVAGVNRIRLGQSIGSQLAMWLVMVLGGELWLFASGTLLWLATGITMAVRRFGRFFRSLFRASGREQVHWRTEIWPLQWRYSISWLSGFATFSLAIPILFATGGPVMAGRMGINWSIILALWNFAVVIVRTKMPAMAMAGARGRFPEMEGIFVGAMVRSTALLLAGVLGFGLSIALLHTLGHPLSDRFLPPVPTALLCLAIVPAHLRYGFSTYVRSQKEEPFWTIGIMEGTLAVVLLPTLGSRFGPVGIATGLLVTNTAAAVWAYLLYRRFRRERETSG